jgi:hypothetical protein
LVTFDKLILWFVHSFSSCTRLVLCREIYPNSRLKFSAIFHLRQTPFFVATGDSSPEGKKLPEHHTDQTEPSLVATDDSSPGGEKMPEHHTDHSIPCSVENNNLQIYTSIIPHSFMAWLSVC